MPLINEIDLTSTQIKPKLSVHKPDKTTVGYIPEAFDISLDLKLGGIHSLAFSVPFRIERNHQLVTNPNIAKLKYRYLVKVTLGDFYDYFVINKPIKTSEEDGNTKTLECFSLAYELSWKKLRGYTAISKNPETVLTEVLAGTGWSVGTISDLIANQYRSFEQDNNPMVLDFILTDMVNSFSAIAIFNGDAREVSLYKSDEIGINKGLRFNYGHYIESLTDETDPTEFATRLTPVGKDGLTVNEVNPTGQSYLMDYSHFMYPFTKNKEYPTSAESTGSGSGWSNIAGIYGTGVATSGTIVNTEPRLTTIDILLNDVVNKTISSNQVIATSSSYGTYTFSFPVVDIMSNDVSIKLNFNGLQSIVAKGFSFALPTQSEVSSISVEISARKQTVTQQQAGGTIITYRTIYIDSVGIVPITSSDYMSDSLCEALLAYNALLASKDGKQLMCESATTDTYVYATSHGLQTGDYIVNRNRDNAIRKVTVIDFNRFEVESIEGQRSGDRLIGYSDGSYRKLLFTKWDINDDELILRQDELYALKQARTLILDRIAVQQEDGTITTKEVSYTGVAQNVTISLNNTLEHVVMCKASTATDLNVALDGVSKTIVAGQWVVLGKKSSVSSTVVGISGTATATVDIVACAILADEYGIPDNEAELIDKYCLNHKDMQITAKQAQVDAASVEINAINSQITTLQSEISLANNFTADQLSELAQYNIDRDWEAQDHFDAIDLYEDAKDKFSEINVPKTVIKLDIVDFLTDLEIPDFEKVKLVLGDEVRIMHDVLGTNVLANIIEVKYVFDDENSIELTIADAKKILSENDKVIKALYKSIHTTSELDKKQVSWNQIAQNFDSRNDRIADSPATPTLSSTPVKHIANGDGSVDITLEWEFDGTSNAYKIDGFYVYMRSLLTGEPYFFGASVSKEDMRVCSATKRAFKFPGMPATYYYTFGVQAYRVVDADISSDGILKSEIVQYNAYRPMDAVQFEGDLSGSIDGLPTQDVVDLVSVTYPADQAAIDQRFTTAETQISQNAQQIDLRATIETTNALDTRLGTAEGSITLNAEEIALRVRKDSVISEINQSAEAVTINASKIDLTGYVTVSDLSGSGTTVINGSNVTTGTISADRISATVLRQGANYKSVQIDGDNGLRVIDPQNRERVRLGEYVAGKYGMVLYDATGNVVILDQDGILQTWQEGRTDSVDSEHPLVLNVYVPASTISLHKVLLRFRRLTFRSYTRTVSSGGSASLTNTYAETWGADGSFGYHTHTMPQHTHYVPEHNHALTYGIYDGSVATSITVTINDVNRTSALGGPFTVDRDSLDITQYLVAGQWNTISLGSSQLGRIDATVFVQAKMGV